MPNRTSSAANSANPTAQLSIEIRREDEAIKTAPVLQRKIPALEVFDYQEMRRITARESRALATTTTAAGEAAHKPNR
jgi:hypothetical protein